MATANPIRVANVCDCEKAPHADPDGPSPTSLGPEIPSQVGNGPTAMTAKSEPYSIFGRGMKTYIVCMVAIASLFSPLTANIYFPALNTLAIDLHVSNTLINLTLTSYMIFQGLAPTIFGDLSDMAGRRPAYLIGFLIYIGANIGLALQDNYVALFILRCLQSTGSSSAVALGSGVVADISSSSERGKYMGIVQAGNMLGPTLGPLLGGVLAQFLGWQSIFWFLVISASAWLVLFAITLPETSRHIVGNGSITAKGSNMSLLQAWRLRQHRRDDNSEAKAMRAESQRRFKCPNPLKTIVILGEKDVALILLFNSLIYAGVYDVLATTPLEFTNMYGFNDLQIGLCYLPVGVGCIIASFGSGRLMDWNFKRLAHKCGLTISNSRGTDLRNFPIEKARIQVIWPTIFIGLVPIVSYGWVLQQKASLVVPLILQFIIGVGTTCSFITLSTLVVDLYPQSPATSTAAINITRCLMGAGATGIINIMMEKMGKGWCFTFVGGVCLAATPLLWVVISWGPTWREERRIRLEQHKAAKNNGAS